MRKFLSLVAVIAMLVAALSGAVAETAERETLTYGSTTVSYTHLTLPTIRSV